MLELVPEWLGRALRGVRAGSEQLAIARAGLDPSLPALTIGSPAFADGARMPPRFTADGEGVSPPLIWSGIPEQAASLALIVEDADVPAPRPLVHAIVWGLAPDSGGLKEGDIRPDGKKDGAEDVGRNSYFLEGWLPPDPPTGHGRHRYIFQLFALAAAEPPGGNPGRVAVLAAMEGKILAAGLFTGTYSRGEPAKLGPAAATRRLSAAR